MTARWCRWTCRLCRVTGHAKDPVREVRLHLLHAHAAVTGTRLSIFSGTNR